MDFGWSEEQALMKRSLEKIVDGYDEDYWREVRAAGEPPEELYEDLVEGGWVGMLFPEEYGGLDMDVVDLAMMMEVLATEGAWSTGLVGSAIFGGLSILSNGTERQKDEYLTGIVEGDTWALGVTEPNAGVNTMDIETTATAVDGGYEISGQKMFISGVDDARRMLLLARTTPKEDADSKLEGITMFIVDPDSEDVDYEEIPLDIYWPHSVYQVHVDDARVSEEQVLGTVDDGIYGLFDTLNVERIGTAAQLVGTGRWVLDKAVKYANDRVVWSEPIGAHQAIQHPLADAYAELESASLAVQKAAWAYDNDDENLGELANIANLQSGKAAWQASEAAMSTLGGMSASTESGVAAAWEFIRHNRIAPLPEEMIRNYLGQNALGLPRSYS